MPDPTDEAFAKLQARKSQPAASRPTLTDDQIATDPRFITELDPEELRTFAAWKRQYAPQDSGYDYDLRGAFKANLTPDPQSGHWPDTFKKPNHDTYSDESRFPALYPEFPAKGSWNGTETFTRRPLPGTAATPSVLDAPPADPTNEAFARMQARTASDPTEAAFAKMQGKPARQFFAAQRPDTTSGPAGTPGPAFPNANPAIDTSPEPAFNPREQEAQDLIGHGFSREQTPLGKTEARIQAPIDAKKAADRLAHPPGFLERTGEGIAGAFMAAPLAADELVRRQQPGGDIFDKPIAGPVAAGAIKGGVGTGFALTAPVATSVFSAIGATPQGKAAFDTLHKPAEFVKEHGGGEFAQEATDQATQLAAMLLLHKGLTGAAAKIPELRAERILRGETPDAAALDARAPQPEIRGPSDAPGMPTVGEAAQEFAKERAAEKAAPPVPEAKPEIPNLKAPIPEPEAAPTTAASPVSTLPQGDAPEPAPVPPEPTPAPNLRQPMTDTPLAEGPPEKGMVVAAKDSAGKVYYGQPGTVHAEMLGRVPEAVTMGFAGPDGKFLTRAEAAEIAAPKTKLTYPEGELDARDLKRVNAAEPTPAPETPPESPPTPAPTSEEAPPAGKKFGTRGESGSARIPDAHEAWSRIVDTQKKGVLDAMLDAINEPVKRAGQAVIDKAAETPPGRLVKRIGRAIYDGPKAAAKKIGQGFAAAKDSAKFGRNVGEYEDAQVLKSFDSAMKDATPEQQAAVTEWGRRSRTAPDTPFPSDGFTPEQVATIQAGLKHFSEAVRGKVADVGGMSQQALEEYPRFLPRMYEEFQQPAGKTLKGASPKSMPYQTAHDGWGGQVKLPEIDAAKAVGEMEPDYLKHDKGKDSTLVKFSTPEAWQEFKDNLKTIYGKDAGKLITGEFEKFDPKEHGLTQVTDPSRLLKSGLRESRARIAKHSFFNSLAEATDEGGKYVLDPLSSEATRATRPENVAAGASAGYTKLEGRGWGPLDGKLVRADAANALQEAFGPKGDASIPEKVYDFANGATSIFKESHAVFNPALVARHIGSIEMQLRLAGIEPLNPENGPRIVNWLKETAPGGKWHEQSVGYGDSQGGNYLATEEIAGAEAAKGWTPRRIGRAIFSAGTTEGFGSEKVKSGYIKSKQVAGQIVGKPYEAVRRIIRAEALDRGLSPEEAQAQVERYTLQPSEFSEGTKFASNVGSPFLRFRLGILRIMGHAAYENPVRLGIHLMRTRLLQAGLAVAGGVALTKQEKEQADNEHPGELAVGRDDGGRPIFLNTRYLAPEGDFLPGRTPIGKGLGTAEGNWDYAKKMTGFGDNPLVSLSETMVRGENRFGQDVKPGVGWLKEAAREFAPAQTPGVGWESHKVASAIKGQAPSVNTQRQSPLEAFLEQAGIRLHANDPRFEKTRIAREELRAVGGVKRPIRMEAKTGEKPDVAGARDEIRRIAEEAARRRAPFEAVGGPK